MIVFIRVEEASGTYAQVGDVLVVGVYSVDCGQISLRLGNHFAWCKPLPGRGFNDVGGACLNHAIVLKSETGRGLTHLLQLIPGVGLARLDDQIADAELLQEGHCLLARSSSDGEHGDDG